MAIPEYTALMVPLLRRAAKAAHGLAEVELARAVAGEVGLSPEDAARRLPSGTARQFDLHVQWARAYLESSGFLAAGEGRVRITPSGRDYLARWQPDAQGPLGGGHMEAIAVQHSAHRKEVEAELLRRVHAMSADFFEQLVLDLMLAMGYGSSRAGLSRVLGRSGDGGLDGEIVRDELGLQRIYLQAKRYLPESVVPLSDVRDFAGALGAKRAHGGVLMSTAQFSDAARLFVEQVSLSIVLVDGPKLASLMLNHGIGVRLVRNYAVHHVDVDYFRE
jgi:restriction system protein